jgi:hypothetical protein
VIQWYSIITTESLRIKEGEFDWLNAIPIPEVMNFESDVQATEVISAPRLF